MLMRMLGYNNAVAFFFVWCRDGAIAFDCAIANATVGAMLMQMRVNDIAILYDM